MRRLQVLVFFFLIVFSGFSQELWMKQPVRIKPVVCYASTEVHKSFVKPPVALKSANSVKTSILVDYVGFPDDAKAAFQFAVEIWQNLIDSPVPIHVKAVWESLDSNVLGSCSPSDYYMNFNSTQSWNCYYPVALVEKLLGKEINAPTDYDIDASFNKDFTNWYFGTDGNTPANKYDFVTTVLHELAHGLGFNGFFYVDSRNRGGYGNGDGVAASFDRFVQNKSGDKLLNTSLFSNPSADLYKNLTSGWLNFSNSLNAADIPRLYAPSTWDSGSSIYHLNDATYPAGTENALMTHAQSLGEANFDPGPKALAMLYDIGWKSVLINFNLLKDIEFVSSPVDFDATVVSDFDLDTTRIFLIYSTTKFQKADTLKLKLTDTPDLFRTQLKPPQNSVVYYYFSASDTKKRTFVYPSNAPVRYFTLTTGVDKIAPVVDHQPIKFMLSSSPSAKIEVTATDNIGIRSVYVEYFLTGGLVQKMPLTNDAGDHYSGTLSFDQAQLKGNDVVNYRVVATDISSQNNLGASPQSGYYTFTIESIQAPVDRYVTNFNSTNQDFIGSDFSISTPANFDNAGLNSAHPYQSPDTDDTYFNFSTILRYPILLNAKAKMKFDEVVLVEPGEAGAKFGDQNFWDYVIVEGSTDGGVTWKPLTDGYDSNSQKSWLDLWNSTISGNNSTAVANKDLYVKHEIDMLANGNFKVGDVVLIRFRLFSDPYSHGWGWIIDNLAIQDLETANGLVLSAGEVRIFPNPVCGELNVAIDGQKPMQSVRINAFNSVGTLVYQQIFPVGSSSFHTTLDVSNFAPGLYLFAVEPEKATAIARKIVIR